MCRSKCLGLLLAFLIVLIAFVSRGLVGTSPAADGIAPPPPGTLPPVALPLDPLAIQPQDAATASVALAAQPTDNLKKLREERLAVAREYARQVTLRVKNSEQAPEELLQAARLVLEAELDLAVAPKERIDALKSFLLEAKRNEDRAARLASTGQGRQSAALLAKTERLRAEIALEEAQAKASVKSSSAPTPTQDELALAENQAAIKKAALYVAQAQKARTMAKLAGSRALVAAAAASESFTGKQLERIEELFTSKSVEVRLVDEHRMKRDSAKARRTAAEANVAECEGQIGVDEAQIELARQEYAGAELRVKMLKERLRPMD